MKSLSEAAARHYREQGYVAPIPALASAEAAALRRKLEAYEAGAGVRWQARCATNRICCSPG